MNVFAFHERFAGEPGLAGSQKRLSSVWFSLKFPSEEGILSAYRTRCDKKIGMTVSWKSTGCIILQIEKEETSRGCSSLHTVAPNCLQLDLDCSWKMNESRG